MSHRRETSSGHPHGDLPEGDGVPDASPGVCGAASADDAQPSADCEIVILNAKSGDASDSRAIERRSRIFGGPIVARPPVGMASIDQVDAFRELRTRLAFMAAGVGLTHFTTMVVPLSEGCGGSFVARNLAAAFTMQQRIAVLVDCNFRNPSQQEALGLEGDVGGLTELLDGSPDANLQRLIRPTPIPGLYLIPTGPCDAGPEVRRREYLSSAGMRDLMSRLREESCDVFLDGPPVRGAPDARILSDLADFVVVVVGYGRATNHAIAQAAALFDPRKFAGVVFNEYTGRSNRASSARR